MLQFWKKSGSKAKQEARQHSPSLNAVGRSQSLPLTNGSGCHGDAHDPGCSGPLRGLDDQLLYGDLGASESSDESQRHKSSKLSKSLREVLADKGALGYFIQYMEARQKVGYIKLWLDCESFCAAAQCLQLTPSESEPCSSVPWAVTRDSLECVSVGADTASIASTEDGSVSPRELPSVSEETEECVLSRADSLARDALNDAVHIYHKYLSPQASRKQAVTLPEEARLAAVEHICREDGQVAPECFAQAQQYVYNVMEKEYFNDFLRSDFHCKHQIDILTSGNVNLSDILFNETALFHFAEFMEQEGKQSLLEFWLAATNFQQQLLEKAGSYDAMEAQNDAIILYDKYFSLQATSPLGFSDKVRLDVEQNICREEGPLPDCFEQPARVVFNVLEKNFFKPFLSSQLYLKYLSELINTIQSSHALLSRRRSDCSSEQSLSSHNLTPAGEEANAPRKVIHNVDEREMSIDSRQLYDPDSLWRRRHQSGLSFGRINELGRFETDFEPEPDRKGESRLTRVVKKFVNLEEDKAKEEMAWQIAAMIVKDVTSVTLAASSPTSSDKNQPLNS